MRDQGSRLARAFPRSRLVHGTLVTLHFCQEFTISSFMLCFLSTLSFLSCTQSRKWYPDTKMTLKTKACLKIAFLADSCRHDGFGVVVWICVVFESVVVMTHWAVETSWFWGVGRIVCRYVWLVTAEKIQMSFIHPHSLELLYQKSKYCILSESIHASNFSPLSFYFLRNCLKFFCSLKRSPKPQTCTINKRRFFFTPSPWNRHVEDQRETQGRKWIRDFDCMSAPDTVTSPSPTSRSPK